MINRVTFLGSKEFGLECLKSLFKTTPEIEFQVITFNDSKDSRSVLGSFEDFALKESLSFHIAQNSKEVKSLIKDFAPDLCFVNGWYWILDSETINFPRKGFIGIHNSLLPKYRGMAPLVWAIINGDEQVGSSIFYIGDGMDEGDLLLQSTYAVGSDEQVGEVLQRIKDKTLKMLPEFWTSFISDQVRPQPQDNALATYCGQRKAEDGALNWSWSAVKVHNFIRAQAPPYPCAFFIYKGEKVYILNSSVFPYTYYGTPGQVLKIEKNEVLIACGEHTAIKIGKVIINDEEKSLSSVISTINTRLVCEND